MRPVRPCRAGSNVPSPAATRTMTEMLGLSAVCQLLAVGRGEPRRCRHAVAGIAVCDRGASDPVTNL
jgi:hypothetical protein